MELESVAAHTPVPGKALEPLLRTTVLRSREMYPFIRFWSQFRISEMVVGRMRAETERECAWEKIGWGTRRGEGFARARQREDAGHVSELT